MTAFTKLSRRVSRRLKLWYGTLFLLLGVSLALLGRVLGWEILAEEEPTRALVSIAVVGFSITAAIRIPLPWGVRAARGGEGPSPKFLLTWGLIQGVLVFGVLRLLEGGGRELVVGFSSGCLALGLSLLELSFALEPRESGRIVSLRDKLILVPSFVLLWAVMFLLLTGKFGPELRSAAWFRWTAVGIFLTVFSIRLFLSTRRSVGRGHEREASIQLWWVIQGLLVVGMVSASIGGLGGTNTALIVAFLMVCLSIREGKALMLEKDTASEKDAPMDRRLESDVRWAFDPVEWRAFWQRRAEGGLWFHLGRRTLTFPLGMAAFFGMVPLMRNSRDGQAILVALVSLFASVLVCMTVVRRRRREARAMIEAPAQVVLSTLEEDDRFSVRIGDRPARTFRPQLIQSAHLDRGYPPSLLLLMERPGRWPPYSKPVQFPIPDGREAEACKVARRLMAEEGGEDLDLPPPDAVGSKRFATGFTWSVFYLAFIALVLWVGWQKARAEAPSPPRETQEVSRRAVDRKPRLYDDNGKISGGEARGSSAKGPPLPSSSCPTQERRDARSTRSAILTTRRMQPGRSSIAGRQQDGEPRGSMQSLQGKLENEKT